MTRKPIFIRKNDKMRKMLQIMSQKRISGCPVVDSKNKIVGIVTETDIIRMIDVHAKIHSAKDNIFPYILSLIKSEKYDEIAKEEIKKMFDIEVKNFMSKKVVTIDHSEDVHRATRLMNSNDIDKLPVIRNNKLVGIVTKWDIIKTLENI